MSCVYALVSPTDSLIRYVGKTSGSPESRLREHLTNARRGVARQRRLCAWIRSLVVAPLLVVLEEEPDDLNVAERDWIEALRLLGAPLCNMTDGGDGQSKGYNPSAATRAKVSLSLRGRTKSVQERANLSAAQRGRRHTAETRAKISAANSGRPSPRKRVWGDAATTEAVDLYRDLRSVRRTAAALGVGTRQLGTMLRAAGVIIPKTGRRGYRHSAEARQKMSESKRARDLVRSTT